MINEDGESVVYLSVIDYGSEEGGELVDSVHDTYDGASKALKKAGFRPSCVFGPRGEWYAYKGKTADEYPLGIIDDFRVTQ